MTLYEINEQMQNCIIVNEETGECIVDERKLAELEVERETKIENIALYIKNLTAEQPVIQAEINRLQAMKKANEKKVESLREYLKQQLNGQKFRTVKTSVSFRSVPVVTLTDTKKIPDQFKRYAEPTVDKIALKKALAEGKKVEGASLTYSTSIIIK